MKAWCSILGSFLFLYTGALQATELQEGVLADQRGDYATAVAKLRPLAEQGEVTAEFKLGKLYQLGHGVPRDYAQALVWYGKAIEQGDVRAGDNMATMYALGVGVPRDYARALAMYREDARKGSSHAQYSLGVMYQRGWGVRHDDTRAVRWYARRSVSILATRRTISR